jgi:Na+/H+-translocating membrane pyrophosphatase
MIKHWYKYVILFAALFFITSMVSVLTQAIGPRMTIYDHLRNGLYVACLMTAIILVLETLFKRIKKW